MVLSTRLCRFPLHIDRLLLVFISFLWQRLEICCTFSCSCCLSFLCRLLATFSQNSSPRFLVLTFDLYVGPALDSCVALFVCRHLFMTRVCLPFGFCACHKKRRDKKMSWKSNFSVGLGWCGGGGATNMRSSVMNAFEWLKKPLGK